MGILSRLSYPVDVGRDYSEFDKLIQKREVLFYSEEHLEPHTVQSETLTEVFPFDDDVCGKPGKTHKSRSQKQRGQAKPQRLLGRKWTGKSADPA